MPSREHVGGYIIDIYVHPGHALHFGPRHVPLPLRFTRARAAQRRPPAREFASVRAVSASPPTSPFSHLVVVCVRAFTYREGPSPS